VPSSLTLTRIASRKTSGFGALPRRRLERPVLPLRHLLQHGIGDGADQVGRDLDAVQLAQVPLDLAGAHPPRVHRHDLVVEAGEAALALGDQLRVEGGQPVARDLQLQLAGPGEHGLAAVAVAAVGPPVRLAGVEMMIHLGVQRPLGQRLLQPVQQAPVGQGGSGVRPAQELVEQFIRDGGLFASWHTMAPSAASYGPTRNFRHSRLEISEGALANLLQDSAPAFAVQTSLIRQRLLSGTVPASDETSVRVGKKTFWTWVFHHADSACFVIRPSRGKAVVGEFLNDVRPAVWISDRLGAQRGWATRDHQVCLAHLLRDVQYAIDAGDAVFAPGMKHLLQRAVRVGHRRPALADATLAAYHARLQRALDDLLKVVPDNKPGLKLQRIIKRFRQSLFVFLTDREVSPTNNGSEQALRPCVIFRKVTNGFRSEWGAALYADVRSVLETARRRGIPILRAIRLTLDAAPLPAGP
jgi:transposase